MVEVLQHFKHANSSYVMPKMVQSMVQSKCKTNGWMTDHLQVDKPSQYVASHLG